MTDTRLQSPDLRRLAELFYDSLADLGQFAQVQPDALPNVYRRLLAHDAHMTVTVEEYHQDSVDVRVLGRVVTPTHYARRILLMRHRDGRVVQFGIMRVNWAWLDPQVRTEIEQEDTPLGRILINHDVLRRIRLSAVWRVAPSVELRRLMELKTPQVTYGRTAIIECDHEPAIELLEIVTPFAHPLPLRHHP
jgi:chorismate-pyruvate lyase